MIAGFPGKLRENEGNCGKREIAGNARNAGNCGKWEAENCGNFVGIEAGNCGNFVGIVAGNCGKVCGNSRKFPQVGSTFILWNVTYNNCLFWEIPPNIWRHLNISRACEGNIEISQIFSGISLLNGYHRLNKHKQNKTEGRKEGWNVFSGIWWYASWEISCYHFFTFSKNRVGRACRTTN